MNHWHPSRIVAIEARQSRFGYAVFEGPDKLLDWGASAIPPGHSSRRASAATKSRVLGTLRRCHPEMVVLKRPRITKPGGTQTPGPIFRAVLRESAGIGIPVSILIHSEVKDAFRSSGVRKKDDVAEVLVGIFPELLPRLPQRRRNTWKPEWRAMIVFDAIAAGFAFWVRKGVRFPLPE
jgi:hypothetical protein